MNSKNIGYDVKAGIIVFLVALPLCLGIALACKAPLLSGIMAGVIGGMVVTLFSDSKLSVSGPAAGLTTIVLSAIISLGSFEVFIAATFFAGIVQLLFALLKGGKIGDYIPNAVIKGMLAGIGLILIIKQIPHLIGYDKDPEGDLFFIDPDGNNTFSDLLSMLNFISPGAIIVALVSFALLFISEKVFYKKNKILSLIPGPLLVVVIGILLNKSFLVFNYEPLKISSEHLVNLPLLSSFSDLSSFFLFPDFSQIHTTKFWIIVFTIAIVASLESLLSVKAADKLDPEKRISNGNKELLAQGIGNILCGLLGALPVTAVIVRSSANINAGAKTKLSIFIHAVLLLLCVFAIPKILMLIPNASLASILIMIGYKLARPTLFKEYYTKGFNQLIPFIITIVVMLLTDLLRGVAAGIIVSVFYIIRENTRSAFEVAKDFIGNKAYYLIKLPQHITYLHKGYLIEYFISVKPNSKVIIDGINNKMIDSDASDVIEDFISAAKLKNIEVELIKFKLHPLKQYL